MNQIRERFPLKDEIILVFGVVVFACFSWTLRGYFEELPSFRLYFLVKDLLAIFFYMMAFALLESLSVTGALIFIGAVLPAKWLKAGFAYKGFILVSIGALAAIRLQANLTNDFPTMQFLYESAGVPLLLAVILILVASYFPRLQSILLDLQDRILIMSYIYVPLGIISLVIVLFRLVFGGL